LGWWAARWPPVEHQAIAQNFSAISSAEDFIAAPRPNQASFRRLS